MGFQYYNSKTFRVSQRKKNLILDNIRELDGVLGTKISILYTRLLVHVIILLAYSKGYVLSLRLTYVKHVI